MDAHLLSRDVPMSRLPQRPRSSSSHRPRVRRLRPSARPARECLHLRRCAPRVEPWSRACSSALYQLLSHARIKPQARGLKIGPKCADFQGPATTLRIRRARNSLMREQLMGLLELKKPKLSSLNMQFAYFCTPHVECIWRRQLSFSGRVAFYCRRLQ